MVVSTPATPNPDNFLVELYDRLSADRGDDGWPDEYVNRDSGRPYKPHHEEEARFVYDDNGFRYGAALGGEGGGKSVMGIIKTLNRLRRGMDGMMVSPNLPHFKRSLWIEFARWCPWDQVVENQQKRGRPSWEPYQTFILTFKNGARLYCGGIEEPIAWEGPNLSFAHFDEARRAPDARAIKVMDGRVRINGNGLPVSPETEKWLEFFDLNVAESGPNGEKPQLWITTTPSKHWLFDMFGPTRLRCLRCGYADPDKYAVEINAYNQDREPEVKCPQCGSDRYIIEDEYESFKRAAYVIRLFTKDNAANLTEGYVEQRAQSLTEDEKIVLLEGGWADLDVAGKYLANIGLWRDKCFRGDLPEAKVSPESERYKAPPKPDDAPDDWEPPKPEREPMIIAVDAGAKDDHFALVMGSVHLLPVRDDSERLQKTLVLRYAEEWIPPSVGVLDFQGTEADPGPERRIKQLCRDYDVAIIAYDPSQLLDMMTRLGKETRKRNGQNVPLANFIEFAQGGRRLEADSLLKQAIEQQEVAHDGQFQIVETHLNNAFARNDAYLRRVRIVKQTQDSRRKVDLAVALSMLNHAALVEKLDLPKSKHKTIKFMSV